MRSQRDWHVHVKEPDYVAPVSEDFLQQLIAELDSEVVTAIALVGSAVRGEITPYSDVDLIRWVNRPLESHERKKFLYMQGRLVSISSPTIAQGREWFQIPEQAIFVVPSLREARSLLDKKGDLRQLQMEAWNWTWEPLQAAANEYASKALMVQIEIVHKTLRAFLVRDELALSEMTFILLTALTDALAVQRGILCEGGNTYFRQVQEAIGFDSTWTHYHRLIADIEPVVGKEDLLEAKAIASLYLYQETVQLLQSTLCSPYAKTIEQTVELIENAFQDRVDAGAASPGRGT